MNLDCYNDAEWTKVGLKLFADIEEADLDYQFNILRIWIHESGRLFWAQDSGCSCPAPFEDEYFNSPEETSLSELKPGNSYEEFMACLKAFPAEMGEKNKLAEMVDTHFSSLRPEGK